MSYLTLGLHTTTTQSWIWTKSPTQMTTMPFITIEASSTQAEWTSILIQSHMTGTKTAHNTWMIWNETQAKSIWATSLKVSLTIKRRSNSEHQAKTPSYSKTVFCSSHTFQALASKLSSVRQANRWWGVKEAPTKCVMKKDQSSV